MQLTLVAERVIVQGTVRTRLRRLTDLMNDKDSIYIVLTDATFMEVGSRRIIAQAAAAQIATESILFAHTTSPTQSAGDLRQPKRGVNATLLLPPFTIEGQVYLPYESELHIALAVYEGRFLPVTQARYWALAVAESPTEADLILVNHSKTHVSVAAGVEWISEPPTEKSDDKDNPW